MLLNTEVHYLVIYVLILIMLALRYFAIAGLAYLIFWVWKKDRFQTKRIQFKFPEKDKIQIELKYSIYTFFIFAVIGTGIFWAAQNKFFIIYLNINDYGWTYYYLSILGILAFHDTYFYWMHRAIHYQPIYKIVHKVHHISVNPSPMASFSFHPTEAFFEGLILPLFLLLFPLHYTVIVIFLLFMTIMNVIGHLGYEFFPSGFTQHWFWRWLNTSTHHNMHHKYFNCNYGLYFNFWDWLLKTNHKNYTKTFEDVKLGRPM